MEIGANFDRLLKHIVTCQKVFLINPFWKECQISKHTNSCYFVNPEQIYKFINVVSPTLSITFLYYSGDPRLVVGNCKK